MRSINIHEAKTNIGYSYSFMVFRGYAQIVSSSSKIDFIG